MYRILNLLLWPVWFLFTLRVAWREKDGRYFLQRMGYRYPRLATRPVWIHCASVGEVNTWLPLHTLLVQQYPQLHFVITTNTPTGARMVARQVLRNTQHVYLPMDTFTAVWRFFARIRPRLAIIMETELWPELYRQCAEHTTPLLIANARLSRKTLKANDWLKRRYAECLQRVSWILCRTTEDAENYKRLGADAERLQVIGNLKFAAPAQTASAVLAEFTDRDYVLAASTHADEELRLARIWSSQDMQKRLLVIAPRHPQRCEQILQQLAPLNLSIAVRSRQDRVADNTQIYLADTLGELTAFMARADVVFMGGSLIERGGQNLLEPARLGRAIIVGPHMYNFAAETALFLQHQACIQIENDDALAAALQACLQDAARREELGRRARQLIETQSDMARRYLDEITRRYNAVLSA